MLRLLFARRFGPLFATQFLGAFNDNLYKTAMLFLITYGLLAHDARAGTIMVTLAGAVFILPFLLFSAPAGQLADSMDKARVIRLVKLAEIAIMGVGAFALSTDSILLLMIVLFAMGAHSTFFGPIKYAILPQHLAHCEVLSGTGLVEAGTCIAILTGQIAGGLLGAHSAWAVVFIAIVGYLTGRSVPPALPRPDAPRVDWNLPAASYRLVRDLCSDRRLLLTTLAISWFWAIGTVFTTQFVPLVKGELQADEGVATLFLALFSIGIAIGSVGAAKLLDGLVSARLAPIASLMVSLFVFYLVVAVLTFVPSGDTLSVSTFIVHPGAWHILVALLGLAIAAGVFVVPLYALLQTGCPPSARARVIAANNIVNSAFMAAAAVAAAGLVAVGLDVPDVLIVVGVGNLAILPCALWLRRMPLSIADESGGDRAEEQRLPEKYRV